ncbi:MAG: tetratricopeptide repeat protein [Saprospiraceae bacterium]|nr:tetratricopeptide repeat protein [Saprospiraceae bacterium]
MNRHKLNYFVLDLRLILQRTLLSLTFLFPLLLLTQEPPCDTLYSHGKKFVKQKQFAEAIDQFSRIIPPDGDLQFNECYMESIYLMARCYGQLSNNIEVIKGLEVYLGFPAELVDSTRRELARSLIPDLYRKVGLYEQSHQKHISLLAYRDSIQDSIGVAKSYYELGTLFHDQNNYVQAIDYYEKSVSLCQALKDSLNIVNSYSALGTNHRENNDLERALEYNQAALDLIPAIDQKTLKKKKRLQPYAEMNMGSLLLAMKEYDRAKEHLDNSIKMFKEIDYAPGLASAYLDYGNLLEELGTQQEAIDVFKEGLAIAEGMNATNREAEFHHALAIGYQRIDRIKDAYPHLSQYATLKDRIVNQEQQKRMDQAQFKYELEKQGREIGLLNQELELLQRKEAIDRRFRQFYIASFGLVALLLALFIYWYRLQRAHNTVLEEKNEKINQQNDMLQHLNAELKQFAYIASHDMREPLRSIGAFSSLLQRRQGDKLDDSGKEYLGFIREAVDRMSALLTDLLDYSKINSQQETEWIDMKGIIQTVKSNLNHQLMTTEGEIVVERRGIPYLDAVPTQMMQLFQNLISNSLKFRKPDVKPVVQVAGYAQDGGQVITIKDNGIGIDPKYKEKVFGMFSRLNNKEKFEGTGIGLATCKKIVQQHGGKIWVESEEGKGSTFFKWMPNKRVTFSEKKTLAVAS